MTNIVLEQKLIVLGQLYNDSKNPYMLRWIEKYEYYIMELARTYYDNDNDNDNDCEELLNYVDCYHFNLGNCYGISVFKNNIYAVKNIEDSPFVIIPNTFQYNKSYVVRKNELYNDFKIYSDWRDKIKNIQGCFNEGWDKFFMLMMSTYVEIKNKKIYVAGICNNNIKYIEFIINIHKKHGIIKTFEIVGLTGVGSWHYGEYYYLLLPSDKWINSYDDYLAWESYEKESIQSIVPQELLQNVRSYLIDY
jgi:hypothetical protein